MLDRPEVLGLMRSLHQALRCTVVHPPSDGGSTDRSSDGRPLLLGSHVPMAHQLEDAHRLACHPRVNVWSELGTGKMSLCAWILQLWWLRGAIDQAIVACPGMCAPDWLETLRSRAWPSGLCEAVDARPPRIGLIGEALTASVRRPGGLLTAFVTTYGGVRSLLVSKTAGRHRVDQSQPVLCGARGRRVAFVMDESHMAALPRSQQADACAALAAASRCVVSATATPMGNPLQLREWGMARLVRPDLLMARGVAGFDAFKRRYAVLSDPASRGGGFPVAVHSDMIRNEVLGPMAPYTCRRTKRECLDLPDKVRMRRSFRLPPEAWRLMEGLVDGDRAVLASGESVVPKNALEERLRTVELCGGWLAGRPVHSAKLSLLRGVLAEVHEAEADAPILVWASRTVELLACALVAGGVAPEEAQRRATDGVRDPRSIARDAERLGVALIHGPTPEGERERLQRAWRVGALGACCAHPGVAGAGVNWQHVRASIYYSSPLGTIARQQSEDRVHRHGLDHVALYFDLCVEGGPDEAVVEAHAAQRDGARALLDWLDGLGRTCVQR